MAGYLVNYTSILDIPLRVLQSDPEAGIMQIKVLAGELLSKDSGGDQGYLQIA